MFVDEIPLKNIQVAQISIQGHDLCCVGVVSQTMIKTKRRMFEVKMLRKMMFKVQIQRKRMFEVQI